MRLTDILSVQRVAILRDPKGPRDKAGVIALIARLLTVDSPLDQALVERVLLEREALQSTGIGDGVAIPHGALPDLDHQLAALVIVPDGLDFKAIDDQKVQLLFALVGRKGATGEHLKTLARISRLLRRRELRQAISSGESPSAVFALIEAEEAQGELR
jgi:PTS system nitrogen regulatory IIA component